MAPPCLRALKVGGLSSVTIGLSVVACNSEESSDTPPTGAASSSSSADGSGCVGGSIGAGGNGTCEGACLEAK